MPFDNHAIAASAAKMALFYLNHNPQSYVEQRDKAADIAADWYPMG